MDKQRVAAELVKVAKDLEAVDWGAKGLEVIQSELKDAYSKLVKAHRPFDSAYANVYEAYVRMNGLSKEDSPEGQSAKYSLAKAKDLKVLMGNTLSRIQDALKEIRTLQESMR